MRTFSRGDHVVWRSLPEGNVGYVLPATIVCDDGDVIGLFQHTGSVCKKRTGKRGGPGGRNMLPNGWDGGYSDREWTGRSNLHLHKMGSGHTVIRSWDQDQQSYEGWYVNLEADWSRTPIGFDTLDLILDVIVGDDLSSWSLKDEDELHWAEDKGIMSADEAALARTEAEMVGEAIESRTWPFFEDWSEWKPAPDWPVPQVPNYWDKRWDAQH